MSKGLDSWETAQFQAGLDGKQFQAGRQHIEFILPMNLAASMGRTISPVSGVLIATAEIAQVSSMQIVKRNLIPMLVGLIVMIVYHFI